MKILRNKHHDFDPIWHVQLVLLCVIALQLVLPERLIALPKYLLPALELLCLLGLSFTTPKKPSYRSPMRHLLAISLLALVAIANFSSLQLLIHSLLHATSQDAPALLLSGVGIYITNIVIFGLLYWEMDGGGPGVRRVTDPRERDFLFPQQNLQDKFDEDWHPTFVDYFYVSLTNATAFSPTDTMPLSRRAKLIMGAQAILSLVVVAIIAARAINIL